MMIVNYTAVTILAVLGGLLGLALLAYIAWKLQGICDQLRIQTLHLAEIRGYVQPLPEVTVGTWVMTSPKKKPPRKKPTRKKVKT